MDKTNPIHACRAATDPADTENTPAASVPDAADAVSAPVAAFIGTHYPDSEIVWSRLRSEKGMECRFLHVGIRHEGRWKNVLFYDDDEGLYCWVSTSWQLRPSELPEPVRVRLAAHPWSRCEADSLEYIRTPQREYSLAALADGQRTVDLRIGADGTTF